MGILIKTVPFHGCPIVEWVSFLKSVDDIDNCYCKMLGLIPTFLIFFAGCCSSYAEGLFGCFNFLYSWLSTASVHGDVWSD